MRKTHNPFLRGWHSEPTTSPQQSCGGGWADGQQALGAACLSRWPPGFAHPSSAHQTTKTLLSLCTWLSPWLLMCPLHRPLEGPRPLVTCHLLPSPPPGSRQSGQTVWTPPGCRGTAPASVLGFHCGLGLGLRSFRLCSKASQGLAQRTDACTRKITSVLLTLFNLHGSYWCWRFLSSVGLSLLTFKAQMIP